MGCPNYVTSQADLHHVPIATDQTGLMPLSEKNVFESRVCSTS